MKSGTSKSWEAEELETLRSVYPIKGAKECAELLQRSVSSIQKKAHRLGIVVESRKRWTHEEDDFLSAHYPEKGVNYCLDNLKGVSRSQIYSRVKALNLSCENSVTRLKTTSQYTDDVANINKDIEVLEDYINNNTSILHKHVVCGTEWKARPRDILQERGCPRCAKKGFDSVSEGYLYFLQFPALNICKIGVAKDVNRRQKDFGVDSVLLEKRLFSKGKDALELETLFFNEFGEYLYNTGSLSSGNTETFHFTEELIEEIKSLIKTL